MITLAFVLGLLVGFLGPWFVFDVLRPRDQFERNVRAARKALRER